MSISPLRSPELVETAALVARYREDSAPGFLCSARHRSRDAGPWPRTSPVRIRPGRRAHCARTTPNVQKDWRGPGGWAAGDAKDFAQRPTVDDPKSHRRGPRRRSRLPASGRRFWTAAGLDVRPLPAAGARSGIVAWAIQRHPSRGRAYPAQVGMRPRPRRSLPRRA